MNVSHILGADGLLVHAPMLRLYPTDEVRTMRPDVRFKFGRAYLKAYHRNYPIALPLEDHADRNSLYSMSVPYRTTVDAANC